MSTLVSSQAFGSTKGSSTSSSSIVLLLLVSFEQREKAEEEEEEEEEEEPENTPLPKVMNAELIPIGIDVFDALPTVPPVAS